MELQDADDWGGFGLTFTEDAVYHELRSRRAVIAIESMLGGGPEQKKQLSR